MSIKLLRRAKKLLETHCEEWKYLADSGDAGNWKAEDQQSYKDTQALLAEIEEALKPRKQNA
jgi:hypothetical protein